MTKPLVRPRPANDGLVLEEFSIYEEYCPHKWNKVLLMTDLAAHVLEPNRRLDAIDRKILMVLQEDASLSVAEIGDRVGLSSTPCWKRIQRLEADGVILRRVALVDQNKIGLGISVFVSVESADHSETWLKTFASAVSAMPEVMEFYRMAGDVDYMLRVVVADMASYDVFYKKLIGAGGALLANNYCFHRRACPGDPVFHRRLKFNREAAGYWIRRLRGVRRR